MLDNAVNCGIIINDDPLAQLEERYLHTVEVAGSSPVGITILVKEYCVSQITDLLMRIRYLFAGSADARGLFFMSATVHSGMKNSRIDKQH